MKIAITYLIIGILMLIAVQVCIPIIDARHSRYSWAERKAMCLVREQTARLRTEYNDSRFAKIEDALDHE